MAHAATITEDFQFQKPVELFTVRHGQSLGQVDPSAYPRLGDPNLPLTELGLEQGHNTGTLLAAYAHATGHAPITIYTSTCLRTRQTASQIFNVSNGRAFAKIVPDARIDKQKFGLFDGQFSSRERREKNPDAFEQYQRERDAVGDYYVRPPGGESIADLVEKAGHFLKDVAAEGKPAIIVTHGLPALCLEKIVLGHSNEWVLAHQDTIPNCSVRHISRDGRGNAASEIIEAGKRDIVATTRAVSGIASFIANALVPRPAFG